MSLRLADFVVADRALTIDLEFRPLSRGDALLLYAGQTERGGRGDYVVLSLVNDGRHAQLR